MDEIIVRLARTLACRERLRILSCLVAHGELPPTTLNRKLGLSPTALSGHLAKLVAVGLIKRRRSGGWSYCVAESPYGESTLSGMTLAWLRQVLAQPERTLQDCGVHEFRNASVKQMQKLVHDLIFDAATAFTDLRRLQLLHFLQPMVTAPAITLVTTLQMSAWAVDRQTSKLMRRGYLSAAMTQGGMAYRLAGRFKTPLHARLYEIVRRTWQDAVLRTS